MRWKAPNAAGVVMLIAMGTPVVAQQPVVERTFGGPGMDVGNSIISVPSGGYVVAGYTDGPSGSQRDAWVLRLDEQLDPLWARRYGGPAQDHAWDLALTAEGTFLVAGFRETPQGDDDVWVLHIDGQGSVIGDRTFGGPQNDRAWAITPLVGGDALMLAQTESFGAGAEDVYLLRLNAHGDTVWTRHAGWPGTDRAFSMSRHGTGALFVGMSDSGNHRLRVLVGTVSADGEVRLDVLPGGDGNEIGHGVTALLRGGFLVTGYGTFNDRRSNDVMFLRLDDQGREFQRDILEGAGDERAMMSAVSSVGVVGTIGYAQNNGDWNIVLQLGTPEELVTATWTHASPGTDRGVMVSPALDGGWIVTGTLEMEPDPGQLVVLKVMPN